MKKSNSTWNDYLKPVVVLTVICIVVSAALAAVNSVTAPIIKAAEEAAANAAYLEVLGDADGFEEVTDFQTSNITKVLKATNDAGWVIQSFAKGFGGDVPVVVAFDNEGAILNVKFMENSETAGFGQRLTDAEDSGTQALIASMIGQNSELTGVDTISGVTVSSNAAVSAVNSAINCFNEVVNGAAATVELSFEEEAAAYFGNMTATEVSHEDVVEAYTSDKGTVLVTEAEGFGATTGAGNVKAYVAFDESGTITGVMFDASTETAGLGDKICAEDYTSSFVGAGDASGADTIAGATYSSTAAIDAVNKAAAAFAAING